MLLAKRIINLTNYIKNIFSQKILLLTLISLFFFGFLSTTSGQENFAANNLVITEVVIKGLKKAPKNRVLFFSNNLKGKKLTQILLINQIKKLYATNFFKDIQIQKENLEDNKIKLIITFIEKEQIDIIRFSGNNSINSDKLEKIIAAKRFDFINEITIQSDLKKIKREYIKEGFSEAKIIYRLLSENQNNILEYQILESTKTYLTKIKITGSEFFLPIDLERSIQSAEIDCFSWINESGKFDPEKINVDLQIILRRYLENGFIEVQLGKPKITFIRSEAFTTVEVELNITEGNQYFIKDIDVESLDGDLIVTKDKILADLQLKKGDVYNVVKQNLDNNSINNIYQDLGYAFSKVQLKRAINPETRQVDLLYQVTKREKVYINRIEFLGNRETRDDILRRELTIYDGELFNRKKIQESQSKIRSLGYFAPQAGVTLISDTQETENDLNYNFQLKEIQTGNLSGGLSYSSTNGFGINLAISKSNFLGSGRRIALNLDRLENSSTVRFSFTENYFLDSKWRVTTNISSEFISKSSNSLGYDQNIDGLSQSFSYPIWKNWSVSLAYGLSQNRRLNLDSGITLEEETIVDRTLSNNWLYSTVNHPFFPSNGLSSRISLGQTGGFLGGSNSYKRLAYEFKYFKTIPSFERVVFHHNFRVGKLLQESNSLIPTSARFTLGGSDSIRGFANSEIQGPSSIVERSPNFNLTGLQDDNPTVYQYYLDHRFGIEEVLMNFELLFPLTREGYNLRGVFFYDLGNVFAEDRMYEIVGAEKDYSYLRQSYGVGIRIITPLGILKFDYGNKVMPKDGEAASLFEFTIGGLF